MTALWIVIAGLAAVVAGLFWWTIEIHNESYHIRKEASETDSDNVKVFEAMLSRADRQLELDNTLVQIINLILDHLGLEIHTEPAKSEPAKTTIRPKIERGEA